MRSAFGLIQKKMHKVIQTKDDKGMLWTNYVEAADCHL